MWIIIPLMSALNNKRYNINVIQNPTQSSSRLQTELSVIMLQQAGGEPSTCEKQDHFQRVEIPNLNSHIDQQLKLICPSNSKTVALIDTQRTPLLIAGSVEMSKAF